MYLELGGPCKHRLTSCICQVSKCLSLRGDGGTFDSLPSTRSFKGHGLQTCCFRLHMHRAAQ
jgi:hypothetical protein